MLILEKCIFTSDNAAWAAVIIALVAIIISCFSNRYAKKSLKLSQKVEDYNSPAISIYIINKIKLKGRQEFYYLNLMISNLSRMNNSLHKIELEVFYSKNNQVNSIILEHSDNCDEIQQNQYELSKMPIDIESGKSSKVYFCFNCKTELLNQQKVVKYRLRITDSYGKLYIEDFTLICEVSINEKN